MTWERVFRIWNKVRRGVFYLLMLLLFMVAQNVVFSHVAPLGVRALFLPALVVAVGLFEGGARGGLFGLLAGVLSDLSLTTHAVTFTLLYPCFGFLTGILADFLVNRRFYAYCVLAVAALLTTAFFQMFRLLVFMNAPADALWRTALLQTLWSLPFVALSYFCCKAMPRRRPE